ncbi:MAG: hypothetical protein AMXMBFR64_27250 [Myxococcales bacterium]
MKAWMVLGLVLAGSWLCGGVEAQEWDIRKSDKRPEPRKTVKPAKPGGDDRAREGLDTWLRILEDDPAGGYALGKVLELAGEGGGVPALVARYEERVRKDAKDAGAWLILGHLQRATGDAEAAARSYEAAAADGKSPAPLVALAELRAARRSWAEAITAYEGAIERTRERSGKQALLEALAKVAFEAGQGDVAAGAIERLVATAPGELGVRLAAARALSSHGTPQQALDAWAAVEERAGGDWQARVMALHEMAAWQERLGHDDEALVLLRRALAVVPRGSGADGETRERIVALYRKQGRVKDLIAELLPQTGSDAGRLAVLARLYEEVGDDAKALETYRRVTKAQPRNAEARRQVMALLDRLGRAEEALAELRALIKATPQDPEPELELAERLNRAGQKDRAIDALTRLARKHASDPSVHQAVVDAYVRFGADPRLIEDALLVLRRLEPAEEGHLLGLGEIYWTAGDRDRAIKTWEKLLTLGKDVGRAHLRLAETFVEHDLVDRADAQFQKALEISPKSTRVLKRYAQFLEAQRRWDAAARSWERLLGLAEGDPDAVRAARQKVVALLGQSGRLGAKVVAWREAFARTPADRDAGIWLAEALASQKDWEGAEAAYRRLLSLSPGDIDAMVALEAVLVHRNDLRGAAELALEAAKRDEAHKASHLARAAEYALQRGEEGDALTAARTLVELRPADAGAHARLGDVYRQAGDLDAAMREYEKAVELGQKDYRVAFRLARLYHDAGRIDDEVRVLRQVVQGSDDQAAILQAGQRLIQVGSRLGTLMELEDLLLPLAVARDQKYVYRRLLVDLYHRTTRELTYRLRVDSRDEDARRRLRGLADRGLKPLLDALAEDDVGIRTKAVEVLRDTRSPSAVLPLVRLLDGRDTELRFQAAVALAFGGGEGAVPGLERLAESPDTRLRDVAVWALGGVRGPAALAPLRRLAEKSDSSRTRALACMALGARGQKDGVAVLIQALGEGQQLVRENAAWALGAIGDPTAVEPLVARLEADQPPVRRAAVWALGRIGDRKAARPLVRHLWGGPRSDEELTSWALWRVATGAAEPGQGERLREAYLELARFREAELSLSQALQRFMPEVTPARIDGLADVVGVLASDVAAAAGAALGSDDAVERGRALAGLGGAPGDPGLRLGRLLDGVADEAAHGKLRAALLPVAPHLGELASRGGPEDRASALVVLGKLGPGLPEAAVSAIGRGVGDDDGAVAEAALLAAAHCADARLVEPLLAVRPGARWTHRLALARAAGRLKDARATELLRGLLADPAGLVRAEAVRALAQVAGGDASPAVIAALGDTDAVVVAAAIEAAGALGDGAAVSALERVRDDGPVDVRPLAAQAIGRLSGR